MACGHARLVGAPCGPVYLDVKADDAVGVRSEFVVLDDELNVVVQKVVRGVVHLLHHAAHALQVFVHLKHPHRVDLNTSANEAEEKKKGSGDPSSFKHTHTQSGDSV